MKDWDRREFLKLLASLPTVTLLGCEPGGKKASFQALLLSPEESMRKLILVLGPWRDDEIKQAENFANRFLDAEHAFTPYLPGSKEVVQNLAARFPDGTMAINEIDLGDLPLEEKELLITLARQLYSFTEMRFFISKEPQAGECQGDNTFHTKAPGEL